MPAPRRMMRRTARRTSRRQGAMNSNEPYEEEEVQEAPVQQAPVAPAPAPVPAQQATDDPKVILANRLANGEITPEEYQAAIAALG